jgi:RHS repeat-associated protein
MGSHTIKAVWAGNDNYSSVTSSSITQVINAKATPTLSVSTSATPSSYGNSVTFTATISSGTTGTVTFYDNGTSIGTGTISSSTVSLATSTLAGGTHTIYASYSGDTNNNSINSKSISQTVITPWDIGTVTLKVNGVTAASTNYGKTSTPSSIASALASGVTSESYVYISAVNGTLYLEAKPDYAGVNYPYTLDVTSWEPSLFSPASFSADSTSGNLVGGAAQGTNNGTEIYSYSGSYDGVGNLSNSVDLVMGSWIFGYDTLNRLITAQNTAVTTTSSGYSGNYGCWKYDAFGNRLSQSMSTTSCTNSPPLMSWANYDGTVNGTSNNQMSSTHLNGGQSSGYDASGNITSDGVNSYLYDGDGRICAVKNILVGVMTGYLYDANGTRIAKGSIQNMSSCDPSVNGFQLSTETDYIIGPSGEQMTEMKRNSANDGMAWQHTNVYAGSSLIGTYDEGGLHFYLNDPVGTRRVQTSYAGVMEQTCTGLPYGDGLNCSNSKVFPTEHHFTGKERDTESGNDYFNARYYSSAMGRFMSPDPIIMNDLRMINPQRWNKYAYVINNPLILTDPTGKDAVYVNFSGMAGGFGHSGVMSVHGDGSATFSYKDGEGQIHMDDSLPKVQFDANGTPTADSYASLAKAVADFDTAPGQAPIDPASVGFVYFKTTDSETANLDQYIAQRWGNQEKYRLIGKSCLDYAVGGLNAAGVTNRAPYSKHFSIPNNFWLWLEPQGNDSNSREKVTHRICDADGKNCH